MKNVNVIDRRSCYKLSKVGMLSLANKMVAAVIILCVFLSCYCARRGDIFVLSLQVPRLHKASSVSSIRRYPSTLNTFDESKTYDTNINILVPDTDGSIEETTSTIAADDTLPIIDIPSPMTITIDKPYNITSKLRDTSKKSSKRAMLSFAIPALGIYLCNPLLSNIDNAFVGRTIGTTGLAALSPATVCIDQMLYLFNFLGRATTGIVARAYDDTSTVNGVNESDDNGGNTIAARDAASAPLVVSLICGISISMFYFLFTQNLLAALRVDNILRPAASSYIYWRGSITWATLAQSVCLSTLMATRDAITPLKIISFAAIANIILDAACCVWPFRWGCAGAAAATSVATLISCGFMIKALAKKQILPKIRRLPTRKELFGLFEFTGPLLAVTVTRLCSYIFMQRYAMKLGVQALAGYQLCINIFLFFGLFGEPFSQLSQTQLPSLIDRRDGAAVRATFKSIVTLGLLTSLVIGGVTYAMAYLGSGIISSDIAVQQVARLAAPALSLTVVSGIIANAVDGAFLASKDFGFLTGIGALLLLLQVSLLPFCTSVGEIFGTFTIRLGVYTVVALSRIAIGQGTMGKVFRDRSELSSTAPTQLKR